MQEITILFLALKEMLMSTIINKQLTDDFIDSCTEQGYSKSYCIAHN